MRAHATEVQERMLRTKVNLLILAVLVGTVAIVFSLSAPVKRQVELGAIELLHNGREAIALANRLDGESLVIAASRAVEAPGVVTGFGCPETAAALRTETGRVPVLDEAGVPMLDSEGLPVMMAAPPRCESTQHETVLQALKDWNRTESDARSRNASRALIQREAGYVIPRVPDLLVAADADGWVIARVGREMDDWYGRNRPNMHTSFPLIARAELGQPQYGVIVWRDRENAPAVLMQIGVAPVFDDGAFVGTVTVGYALRNEQAEEDAVMTRSVHSAYFYIEGNDTRFAGTSFANRPDLSSSIASETFSRVDDDGEVASEAQPLTAAATRGAGHAFTFSHGSETYLASFGVFARDDSTRDTTAGFIVVTPLTQVTKSVQTLRVVYFGVAVAFFLLAVLGVIFIARTFIAPIEEISRGVQEVIAGNRDYSWPVDESNHLADLSHALNIMSARLQGKRDPDADEVEDGGAWTGMGGGGARPAAGGGSPGAVAGLGGLKGRKRPAEDDDSAEDA